MEIEWTPIPTFRVIYGVVFGCLFCGRTLQELCSSPHHVSSSGLCDYCQAVYRIDWAMPVEDSVVKMLPDQDEQEFLAMLGT
jgi:hypothetical protein